jgi:dienelactone hydrolase
LGRAPEYLGLCSAHPHSFGPRGISYNCAGNAEQRPVTPGDRAGDVISAALWLRTQPQIDPARIGAIGFSNGGGTNTWVTQRRYEQLYPCLIKAAVNYYGGCIHVEDHGTVPLLVLAGEADDWGFPAQQCREFGAKLISAQVFEIHTYAGAVHCFDCVLLRRPTQNQGHRGEFDESAANDSFIRAKAYVGRGAGG